MKWSWLIILLTYVWINLPSLHDGLFLVYDNVQVTRIEAFYGELKSGQFPVRYIDSYGHGAGYFIFKYYSPLPYYLGAGLMYLGFSAIQAVKLLYLGVIAVGTISMWGLLRVTTTGTWPVLLGTLAFLTAPYLYHDFFHRGAMAEAVAFMLLPFTLLAFIAIKRGGNSWYVAGASIGLAGIILSHSLTGILAGLMVGLYLIIKIPDIKIFRQYILAMILGVALSATSLVPVLLERDLISYEHNSFVERGYLDHPIALWDQWINSQDGDQKGTFLGSTLMIAYILYVGIYLRSKKFRSQIGELGVLVISVATIGLYLMTPSSAWIWERVIYLRYFQFPFRLLTVVVVVLALGYGQLVDFFKNSKLILVGITLLLVVPALLGHSYYQPLDYQYGTSYTVDDPCQTTTWADEYLSIWTDKCLLKPIDPLVTPLQSENNVSNIVVNDGGRAISFEAARAGSVQVAKYYFPEWSAYDSDGSELQVEPYSDAGVIRVTTTRDNTAVKLVMKPSLASIWGDRISLAALLLIVLRFTMKRDERQI